jgi:hypothetical protein
MRSVLAIGLLASLMLAGCASSPTPSGTQGAPGDDDATTKAAETRASSNPPSTSSKPASGTTTAPTSGPSTTAGPAPNSTEPSGPKEHAVSEEGYLGASVGTPLSGYLTLGSDRWFRQDINGTVTGADLTMTWTAAAPTLERLLLTFTPIEVDGESESYTGEQYQVEGTSPLHLAVSGLSLQHTTYTVTAWWADDNRAGPAQDFTIEGTIFHQA